MRRPRRLGGVAKVLVAFVLAATVLGACGSDDADDGIAIDVEPPPVVAEGEVVVRDVRVSEGLALAAAYFSVYAGPGGDVLVGASSPAAERMVAHTMDPSGSMDELERLEIPEGDGLVLDPGGYHLMLEGLEAPLAPGGRVTLVLEFERAGEVTVDAPVIAYDRLLDPLTGGL